MALIKRYWLYIVIVLYSFKLSLSQNLIFEIERRSTGDSIPNNIGINREGDWQKLPSCRRNCRTGLNNIQTSSNVCRCTCSYAFSTFRMGATARTSFCIKNEILRSQEGCNIQFQNEGTISLSISVLNLSVSTRKPMTLPPRHTRCVISGLALFWDYGVWKIFEDNIFSIYAPNPWTYELKWNKTSKPHPGRIMKLPFICRYSNNTISQNFSSCLLFKLSGKVSYNLNKNLKLPTTSSTHASVTTKQATTKQTTTKQTTTKQTTTKQTTTKQTTAKQTTKQTTTKQTTTKQTTTKQTTAKQTTKQTTTKQTTTKQTTTKQTTAKQTTTKQTTTKQTTTNHTKTFSTTSTTVETTAAPSHHTSTEQHLTTHDDMTSTADNILTETNLPYTKATEKSTSQTDVVPGKGAHGAKGDSGNSDNTLMIAAIGAVAAIVCVVIVCIFLWFIIKRKQNNRSNEAYSTDMTVITNGTGMNNTPQAPTLNNPIYDNPDYCEPTEQHPPPHPKRLPKLGNPIYDKAIINKNDNNNKNHPNIKSPSHKPTTKNETNHYDNKEEEAYDNHGYQHLVAVKPVKKTPNDKRYNESTCDNYAEADKPVYEDLSQNAGRDSIYQPLIHNIQGGTPEYLPILNKNTSQDEQSRPEYLTLVGEDNTQSDAGEYDYAFVDEEQKETTRKPAPNTKVAGISKHGPPVYDVLEDPNNEGPPVYDVLEDPNNEGPPLCDVRKGPNDEGPPVYDVLEDPNDEGPPVYDVLEGPDSGENYLIPVEGIQ